MFKLLKNIGPGAMVAAAFIGPGTVTTATLAGSSYGFTLLWAILFSILSTLVLQEMTARLGVTAKVGLGEALRQKVTHPNIKVLLSLLVLAAILVGNAAYEAGNITGAVLGLNYSGSFPINPWVGIIGVLAFLLLWHGRYRLIEQSLIAMVVVMGLVFLLTALLLTPKPAQVLTGLLLPRVPDGSLIMVVGLIGTTVVPYNLFLHASAVKSRWTSNNLPAARIDTVISVLGGGIITMAILITSAIAFEGSSQDIAGISDLSQQLKPLLGNWSTHFMALGFLAAGLSSAITAPLAAALATSEILGWKSDLGSWKFKFIWAVVLLTGLVFSSMGFRPTMVILFAQFANGLLLPILAILLVWIMNDRQIMGHHTNNAVTNILGMAVIAVTILLAIRSIGSVLGQ
jgi:Mn2+/Fe2+ NRAMP family transporter